MASLIPVVLHIEHVHDFIEHVSNHHAPPSTLIVCATHAAFLDSLRRPRIEGGTATVTDRLSRPWQVPTLRRLAVMKTLRVVFCPDIPHLRAYLATYSMSLAKRSPAADTALRLTDAQPTLAILNPLQLHRNTSAFSAQGLSRSLSLAVEASYLTNCKLILAESSDSSRTEGLPNSSPAHEHAAELPQICLDPWDEEVPILNATSKRLGELSVGRTVTVKTVAERWCTFERLPQQNALYSW